MTTEFAKRAVLTACWCIAGWLGAQGVSARLAAQEACVVNVLNRTARLRADGTWDVSSVPANMGPVRARMTCVVNGKSMSGTSELFTITPNRMNAIPRIPLGNPAPTPTAIRITSPTSTLTTAQPTAQLIVVANYPDNSSRDVTSATLGTIYQSTNAAIASVGAEGLVTAHQSGNVLILALHEAIPDTIQILCLLSGDNDGDGMPDDFELNNGLDPNDPADALEDADRDDLSNLEEFQIGTDLRNPDTDGDGITDGEETVPGRDGYVTDPLRFDTDGDGVWDGLEIQVGTDPTSATSVDYARVLERIDVEPSVFTMIVNTVVVADTSRRVRVTGRMIDGNTLDLTAGRGTNYTSSDLSIANFGGEDGRIFAGRDGIATVTIANGPFQTQTVATVRRFAPRPLSWIPIPGYANDVDVVGNRAYVAAGATGLQVIDTSIPSQPVRRGSFDTPGNANDVEVVADVAYVADGVEGLAALDVRTLPPQLLGSTRTRGVASAIVVRDRFAYVADGPEGMTVIDVSIPAMPTPIGGLSLPGDSTGIGVSGQWILVATGEEGVHVVDVQDPRNPLLVGSTHTRANSFSRAADLVVRDNLAFVADGSNSTLGGLRTIDFREPTTPVVLGTTSNSYGLLDVAVSGGFALAADYYFVNSVPIFDIRDGQPTIRGTVNFAAYRDDNGTGIDAESGFVYLTAGRSISNNGSVGDTRLYIGQYLMGFDEFGIPPTVSASVGIATRPLRERERVFLIADARDDVQVDSVQFLVNGAPVFTSYNPIPGSFIHRHETTVPIGLSSLRLTAIATDYGSNQGIDEIVVPVIPDYSPTVAVIAPSASTPVVERTTINLAAVATDDVYVSQVELFVDGASQGLRLYGPYRVPYTVPVGRTSLTITAEARDNVGQATTSEPVVVAVLPDLPPTALILLPNSGAEVVAGSALRVVAGATDDFGVRSVEFFVDSVSIGEDFAPPYELDYRVPTQLGSLLFTARATDSQNQQATSDPVSVDIVPDPGMAFRGGVQLPSGMPAAGADVSVYEFHTIADSSGEFLLEHVPTIRGNVAVRAGFNSPLGELVGFSESFGPLPNAIADVGIIRVRPVQARRAFAVSDAYNSVRPSSLFLLDPASSALTWIGTPPLQGQLGDSAYNAADESPYVLEQVDCGECFDSYLVRLDPSTAAAVSRVLVAPRPGASSVAWSPQGTLLAVVEGYQIRTVDPTTGATIATVSVVLGPNEFVQDIALDPTTGQLWSFIYAYAWSGGPSRLGTIDLTNGQILFSIATSSRITSISFDSSGALFAILDRQSFAAVDKTTGVVTPIGSGFGGEVLTGFDFQR